MLDLFQQNKSPLDCISMHDLLYFSLLIYSVLFLFAVLVHPNYKKSILRKVLPLGLYSFRKTQLVYDAKTNLQCQEFHNHRSIADEVNLDSAYTKLPLGNISFESGNCVTKPAIMGLPTRAVAPNKCSCFILDFQKKVVLIYVSCLYSLNKLLTSCIVS